jgi:hypothetical protein
MDSSKLLSSGFKPGIKFEDGIQSAILEFGAKE